MTASDRPQDGDLIVKMDGSTIEIHRKEGIYLRMVAFAMGFGRGPKMFSLTHHTDKECGNTECRSVTVGGFTWANLVGGARTKAKGTRLIPDALTALGYKFEHQCHLWADGYQYRYVGPLE